MAKFELPIYGENDEVVKTYKTEHIRYGLLEDAIKMQEENTKTDADSKLKIIKPLVKRIFKGLTDEEIEDADVFDIINSFNQLVSLANGLSSNNNSEEKN